MRENTKDARWRSAQFPGKGVRSELCSARAPPRVYHCSLASRSQVLVGIVLAIMKLKIRRGDLRSASRDLVERGREIGLDRCD